MMATFSGHCQSHLSLRRATSRHRVASAIWARLSVGVALRISQRNDPQCGRASGHEFNAWSALGSMTCASLAFVASTQFPRVTIHYSIPIHGTSVLDFDDASPPAVPA
jgi:hypothetical protein